ncbi:TPA: hypothetical protein N0F65_005294 [Lagenidium giganteum]|uniref:F-box protein Hrt3/FBXO9 C-terminal domain-containing protein n=1 Tax=Lagenidium giganteum TaxID=4803 RepID=A0AAV2YXI4_9STRA|nr:TPA: hypothetical protein N0F65_005294 [Lagenidium giganteum]
MVTRGRKQAARPAQQSNDAVQPIHRRTRDADEEALQAALLESVQPDFLAEIIESEAQQVQVRRPAASSNPQAAAAAATSLPASSVPTDPVEDLGTYVTHGMKLSETVDGDEAEDEEEEEEEANSEHVLLNYAEVLLMDILKYLDEDSVGHCICTCKRLMHVARSEVVFETLCRRIFPVQNPRAAAAANRFSLRKFSTWYEMFIERPRVRYNGFYWLKVSYYKKPELNMWTDLPPGSILQCIYYRYFSFQRDGSVLYAMLFKPPHEASAILSRAKKDVYRGSYRVDRNEVFVSVPTNHSVIEFRFQIPTLKGRTNNAKLTLHEHYSFSEPDRTGWIDKAAKETKVMAPIVSSRPAATKSDNNAPTREKSNNSLVKKDDPAKVPKPSSASRATASSTAKHSAGPESTQPLRKAIKTPPSAATSADSAPPAQRAVKLHPPPSAALHKHKQAAMWTTGKKKHKTNFGAAYDAGSIPCRINHGSIKNQLQWTKEPQSVDFNPLLITCVEGFQETEHPFVFLARTAFRELIQLEDARERTLPILGQLINPLRAALMAKEDDIFLMALEGTRLLSNVVEDELNVYLAKIMQQIHRKLLTKQFRTQVEETLSVLERNGGKEALAIIRSKIPTYTSVNM